MLSIEDWKEYVMIEKRSGGVEEWKRSDISKNIYREIQMKYEGK